MLEAGFDPMLPVPFTIERVKKETSDTFTIDLRAQAAAGPFTFTAGQFNMLYIFGVGEVPISISGDPAKPEVLTHTIRAVGTVTSAMKQCRKKQMLGVRGPFGKGWPLDLATGKDVVIAAGGLGLAPLRPAICQILNERSKFGKVTLLYGSRTPDDLLFRNELEKWRGRFDLDVRVAVNSAGPEWRGTVGWITALTQKLEIESGNTISFVCGPEVMMRSTASDLRRLGMCDENIFVSLERNMKCAVGFCGHCMFGPTFICKDGPVFPYARVKDLMLIREL